MSFCPCSYLNVYCLRYIENIVYFMMLYLGKVNKLTIILYCSTCMLLQKRRMRMNQHPKHLPDSLYRAGKSFVMGVGLGISGVVVNPVKGMYGGERFILKQTCRDSN